MEDKTEEDSATKAWKPEHRNLDFANPINHLFYLFLMILAHGAILTTDAVEAFPKTLFRFGEIFEGRSPINLPAKLLLLFGRATIVDQL